MIQKFRFGSPFDTEAVIENIPVCTASLPDFICMREDFLSFSIELGADDIVYGLGENMGGINKRGRIYESNCTDDPNQTEGRKSLYAAHNFVVVDGDTRFGIFVDYPATVRFDIGFTDKDIFTVEIEEADYDLYIITGNSTIDIIKEFRSAIGKSYSAPKWAFGFGQSRWGYKNADDIREVVKGYRDNKLPLDSVYMDIDYMVDYKDFTINPERFPDFCNFVDEMKKQHIHLVPIIDAGVKIEAGYDIYEEGVAGNYFVKDEEGRDFVTAVWPGNVHMPDFLNPEARKWFGTHYKILTDAGIEGFWNDMNEPALFYSERTLKDTMAKVKDLSNRDNLSLEELWSFQGMVSGLANNPEDYKSFYHNVDGQKIRHDRVHNIYGYNMTRAASEAFPEIAPGKDILVFSRSSYVGMHRYAGIWTGDNASWWSHIELLMHQLPGLNMCGFLYCGADMGGFGDDTCEDLLMRFLELSMFTPLMRNHAALGTRNQEIYLFKDMDSFRKLLELRYALIPYLYASYQKAIDEGTLLFTPLGIAFPEDIIARRVEDQLMVGEDIMIAPIYKQNAFGRYVYLPEDMTMLKLRGATDYEEQEMAAGHHYVDVALNEVLIFVRKNHTFTLSDPAQWIS